jgi:uncharacterized protein (DUF2252 family)
MTVRDVSPGPDERRARGKALREQLPRSAHGEWTPAGDRPDVIEILRREVAARDPDLLPLRWARMAESPVTFYRGAVSVNALDLGPRPTAGIEVQLCGDAHVLNLGAYAAPDGHLVFDINDFDHTCRGPFEWDLKRLAASLVLAGRAAGHRAGACRDAVSELVTSYRDALDALAELRAIEVSRLEVSPDDGRRPLAPIFARATRDTPARLLRRATQPSPDGDGRARFRDEPPFLRPLDERAAAPLIAAVPAYRDTLGAGRQQVLDFYRPYDVAARAQGIGSLGVASWVVLLYGNGPADPLFLQIKQIEACAWAPWLRTPPPADHGRRAAEGQARTQTATDPFLGWATIGGVSCLVRQWSDHKARCSIDMLAGRSLAEYADLCGHVLAKAHARTGDAALLSGYCGGGENLDDAIARFAITYADQVEVDHARLVAAIKAGTLPTA